MDAVLENIDIVDAYVRLIGKMQPEVRGSRTEGIKISCPMPHHTDNNPSAWINTDKQTWFCGGCQVGGDIYDLAAIHFGYDLHGYKTKQTFPHLRRALAEKFGYTILSGIAGEMVVKNEEEPQPDDNLPVEPDVPVVAQDPEVLPDPQPSAPVVVPPALVAPDPVAPVVNLASVRTLKLEGDEPEGLTENRDLRILWDQLLPEETFARSWMEHTTIDDLPHEYYFWLAMQALGFVGGHNNILEDFQEVKANLYICLYGRTGLGKSRSMRPFLRLLEEALPFSGDKNTDPEGVRILPTPGSGEALIDSFRWDVYDAGTNQFDHMGSVSGLVRHEELSGLISKAARSGSSIKEVLIEMYDVHGGDVTTHSRTSGITRAHNPFCQMISTTQPNAIHAFMQTTDIESGFINRWIMAVGTPRVNPIPYGTAYQDISMPVQLLKDAYVWARPGHRFTLEDEALEVWTEFFVKELAQYKSGKVAQDSIMSRIDLVLKKLIVCFTINERLDQPTGDIVDRVVRLYPYLQIAYSMFSKDMTFNDVADCQNRVLKMIEEGTTSNKPPSKRDMTRLLMRKFNGEVVVRSLKNLLDLGLIEEVPTPTGVKGRPTIKYALPAN